MILWLLKFGITMLIHNKDDIQFVTEFPCFLGHSVPHISFLSDRKIIRTHMQSESCSVVYEINLLRLIKHSQALFCNLKKRQR